MEITLLPKNGLRLKGKQTTLAIDPQDKATYGGVLLIEKSADQIINQEEVIISSTGEYEIGGIKMTGSRTEGGMLYSLSIDGVEVLVGKLDALEKMQHKLKEHNIVIVKCDVEGNASFITSLAENVVIFYGDKAKEIASSFGKENIKEMSKYSTTKDKLPADVETIVLA
ncbi:hypothetical protein HZA75_05990 [Candidatus Roizmanbacteria bacterium]|nr:hypothetical protein [Candidatus Roizmanbacteria bacterium]